MKKCKNCNLPEAVPGADLDSRGICRFCREYAQTDPSLSESLRKSNEADLEKALEECRGKGEYDCLVPVSGGKDSVYLLYKLKKEYDLKVLAFTTDINIPPLAWQNIRRTILKLDIDHISYRPSLSFYTRLFRYCLMNQEERGAVYTVSYVYAPLFEGDAIRMALQKNIPLILAGYSPGQPEPERMLYEFSRKLITETDWTPPELRNCGQFSEEELERFFFNPNTYPPSTDFPRYLAPFHAWPYSQEEVMREVVRLGLVKGKRHASPIFSNYPINWLLMYSDLIHFGYNPYHPEFSALIREGKASLTYWKLLGPLVNFMIRRKLFLAREAKKSLEWLGLKESDLKITKPKGAYDPPLSLP
ncbi:MAG: hypothetical protein ACLFUE_09300 [Desulfobacteraceae bacterium]